MSSTYRVENVILVHDTDEQGQFAMISCVEPRMEAVRVDLEEIEEGVYEYSCSEYKVNGKLIVLSIEELLVRIAQNVFASRINSYKRAFAQIEHYRGYEDKQFRLDAFIEEKLAVFIATGRNFKFLGKPITYVVLEPHRAHHDFWISPEGEYTLWDEEFARASLRDFLKWCKEKEKVILNEE